MAEEYKEIDEENFGAEEVSLSVPYTEEPLEIPALASAVTSVESVMPETNLPTNNITDEETITEAKTRKPRTTKVG